MSWNAEAISGEHNIRYAFSVQADHLKFVIPPELSLPARVDPGMAEYLREEEGIQVNDPVIEETLNTVLPDRNVPLLAALTSIHGFLQNKVENRNFSGYTDAYGYFELNITWDDCDISGCDDPDIYLVYATDTDVVALYVDHVVVGFPADVNVGVVAAADVAVIPGDVELEVAVREVVPFNIYSKAYRQRAILFKALAKLQPHGPRGRGRQWEH